MIMNIGVLLVIGLLIVIFLYFRSRRKRIKLSNVFLITGGVKTGKSALSCSLAKKTYKKAVFMWYLKYPFYKIMRRDMPLKPMLYSNILLRGVRFNRLTADIIRRKVRIPDKSIVLIDEASLVADSMLFKDVSINNDLMLFVKLWGHYSHNGTMIINTQTISDLHYAFKRCVSQYLYICTKTKYPFITHFKVREMLYSDDNNAINIADTDIEQSTLNYFMFNRIYKMYDYCCYSIFTDDLAYQVDYDAPMLDKHDSLKCDKIISFNPVFENLSKTPKKEGTNNA